MRRSVVVTGLMVVFLLAAAGCAALIPDPNAASKCGDRCAAMTCPFDSSCVMGSDCSARCEPNYPQNPTR